MVSRRAALGLIAGGGLAAGGGGFYLWAKDKLWPPPAPLGLEFSEAEMARAVEFLQKNPAIDCHAHPGRTFVKGAENLTWKLKIYQAVGTFEDRVVGEMHDGGMATAVFNAVADFPVLNATDSGLVSVRNFNEGEAWSYFQMQLQNLKALESRGLVMPVLEPDDIAKAFVAGKPGAMLAVEGGDFVGDDPAHIEVAANAGLRMVTLVHYLSGGKIGDIMTAPPVNGGLTDFGADVVRRIHANRLMLDLAHATEKTAFDAIAAAPGPVVATHTHITGLGIGSARFISPELARAIADTGGYIGAWPAGIGISTFAGFIRRIVELTNVVGIDHVALGTDMDANYKPVWETYKKTPYVVAGLFREGYGETDVAKIIGGNFLRVFKAVREA